jgi:XTP/dITP diphosphohydrolase
MLLQTLLTATRNQGKLKEIRQLLRHLPFILRDLNDFPALGQIEETGKTFAENASLKAAGYATQTGLLTLADDSGLEVDGLKGGPGVLSARYAGDSSSDTERTAKLLTELSNVQSAARAARFVSVIAIADGDGRIINISTGVCEGRIALEPKGSNGFGYDPIFIPDGYDVTFAELKPEIKNQISHRARALVDTHEFLRTLTVASSAR